MVDYMPTVPPVGWSNSYSGVFCSLLSIVAAAKVVRVVSPQVGAPYTIVEADGLSGRAAKFLLTQELLARLNTGSSVPQPDWDWLVDPTYAPLGLAIADDFARRATAPQYSARSSVGRFSVPVPRGTPPVPDTADLFVQAEAIAAYELALPTLISAGWQIVGAVAAQAVANTAQDPTAAATVATALAATRASYVTQLQAAYPDRGYA